MFFHLSNKQECMHSFFATLVIAITYFVSILDSSISSLSIIIINIYTSSNLIYSQNQMKMQIQTICVMIANRILKNERGPTCESQFKVFFVIILVGLNWSWQVMLSLLGYCDLYLYLIFQLKRLLVKSIIIFLLNVWSHPTIKEGREDGGVAGKWPFNLEGE